MRNSYPEASFHFIDVTALADSKVVTSGEQPFSQPELFQDNLRQKSYGTMELNQFLLDGSKEIFPAEKPKDIPYWSESKSDKEGHYLQSPVLEILFSEAHTSIGLTLYFAAEVERAAEVKIIWYTLYGSKLEEETFYPDAKEYFCRKLVQNYGKIRLEFVRSFLPDRYVKLNFIEYGKRWFLGKNNIKSASVYEEIDPISATLSINTAKIELVDSEKEFEFSNQDGLWKSLQKEQEISITEFVNGEAVDCGTFYLEDWECQKNLVRFSFQDVIGRMDKTLFYHGKIYHKEKAGVIIASIMESCGIEKYSIEEEIYQMELSGWLAIQSHRAALQQVVFACGAVADCSRSDWIRIYRPDRYVSHTIGLDRKFTGTKVTLEEYLSSVSVSYVSYQLEQELSQISNAVLPKGETRIEFSTPYQPESLITSLGTIVEAKTNYVIISMPEERECILEGRKYEAVETVSTAAISLLEAGEVEKTKAYQGCTLMDAEKAKEVAERILQYYQLRQKVDMKYINEGEAVGNWCDMALAGGGHSTTCITSQTLDLTGGNLATAKCRGYNRTVCVYSFADTELFAGEESVL